MQSIFSTTTFKKRINILHDDIKQTKAAHFAKLGIVQPTLLDHLVSPVNREVNVTIAQHQAIKGWLVSAPQGSQVNKGAMAGIYNLPEIGVIDNRRIFVQDLLRLTGPNDALGFRRDLNSPSPKPCSLSNLSQHAKSATTLLALKYFWLCLEYPGQSYTGLPASTGPVRFATWVLWGNEFTSLLAAKTFHTQKAQIAGLNEIDFNSALWLLGRRMKKK
jgi:hypothetical protein